MQSKASTVADYLGELPEDRRAAVNQVRAVIRKSLPKGLAEQMQYGMISYVVPHKHYPAGYHTDPKQALPYAALASQKNNLALYLMTPSMMPKIEAALRAGFQAAGKKLDMGKSCIRFKKPEDLALEVVGDVIGRVSMADYIMAYEDSRKQTKARPAKK